MLLRRKSLETPRRPGSADVARLPLLLCFSMLCLLWTGNSSRAQAVASAISPVITVDNGPNAAAQQSKPYVVLVSLDGFRYDYARKYQAKHLLALGEQGAIA